MKSSALGWLLSLGAIASALLVNRADSQDRLPTGRLLVPESVERGMMIDAAMGRRRALGRIAPDDRPVKRLRIPESIDRGMMIDAQMRTPR